MPFWKVLFKSNTAALSADLPICGHVGLQVSSQWNLNEFHIEVGSSLGEGWVYRGRSNLRRREEGGRIREWESHAQGHRHAVTYR